MGEAPALERGESEDAKAAANPLGGDGLAGCGLPIDDSESEDTDTASSGRNGSPCTPDGTATPPRGGTCSDEEERWVLPSAVAASGEAGAASAPVPS